MSFDQWLQGFEIYMSVFLVQPQHMSESHNMLMYIQTVGSLYEKGADWLSYDEAFRSLRQANNLGGLYIYIYIYIILPDRHQPPATLRPIRRLPVRDQLFSGDSMPTPVSPDALRYILVGYSHNLVP